MSQDHAAVFAWGFPHPCIFLHCSSRKFGTQTFLYISPQWFHLVCILVEYIRNEHDQEMMWVHQAQCFLPAIFMSSTYTDRDNCCFLWTNKHSQFGTIPKSDSNYTSSNCFSHNNPACGCPCKFSQEEQRVFRTGPWLWPFMFWKTYPNIWTFWLWNFEQFWSVFCCVSCLSCTVW